MTSISERQQFDVILEEVLNHLPPEVSELLEEVPIIVEDEPSQEILDDFGIKVPKGMADLCGVHWGKPISERSFFEGSTVPGQILIFRGPIYRLAGWEPDVLAQQIRITLLHEIGHLFGFDEERLKELGYD